MRTALCLVLPALITIPAFAAGPGALISQQVDMAEYQHYHQDLLYTHLGDNKGLTGPQHDPARTNIFNTFQSFGLSVALEPFTYASHTYYNVVATMPGTDDPTHTVVVGSHFDTVNCPGADDNATGCAMVMEVARVLSQHRSSKRIRFITFDREEQGLRGSSAYVPAHSADNTSMAVIADMIGHDSGAYGMDLYSKSTSATVTNGLNTAIGTYGGTLHSFLNFGSYNFSDHWPFELAGIPAVVVIERCYTCNANYHTTNDAVDFSPTYISYALLGDIVRSITGYLVDTVPVSLWSDFDNDGDVDNADFASFRTCFGGSAAPSCFAFDKNMDGAINCADWPAFKAAYRASQGRDPVLDVDSFVGVLLGTNLAAVDLCMGDVNGDGNLDGLDVQAYCNAALGA